MTLAVCNLQGPLLAQTDWGLSNNAVGAILPWGQVLLFLCFINETDVIILGLQIQFIVICISSIEGS